VLTLSVDLRVRKQVAYFGILTNAFAAMAVKKREKRRDARAAGRCLLG